MYELARALAGQVGLGDAGDVIAKHLRRLVPAALCVFYIYDHASDELNARHVVGDGGVEIRGLKIGLGRRLSGWVAANRQTIVNSDAELDLGEAAKSMSPRLRTCLSTPLILDDELIGVLSLYSTTSDGFNEDHKRVIEAIARQIAYIFKGAAEFDGASKRDELTGLPNLRQLEQLVDSTGATHLIQGSAFTLLFIDVVDLKRINMAYGRAIGDAVLVHVVRLATAGLRLADILFRYGSDEFVALLNDTSSEVAALIGVRIREAVRVTPFRHSDDSIPLDITAIAVTSPFDGDSLPVLIKRARAESRHQPGAWTTP